jgi:two-component system OmpR family response regulator
MLGGTPARFATATRTRPADRGVRVLVVADEPLLTEAVSVALRDQGWESLTAADGAEAIRVGRRCAPDIAVVDMALPDMSGLDVVVRLRSERREQPVVLLTAQDAVSDRIAGLAAGVDDCISRPLSLDELILRVRAVLRRSGVAAEASATIVVGDLVLDDQSREVSRGGVDLTLTATEFDVLRYLMHSARRVVTKAEMLDRIWNYDFGGRDNIVELYISYLRKKIDHGREPMIHTLRGTGYVLKAAK